MNSRRGPEMFTVIPEDTKSSSPSAKFCRILAILTWVGGLIVAYNSASVDSGYRGETQLNIAVFITFAIAFGIAGGFLYCMAELLENVFSIAQSLKSIKVFGTQNQVYKVQIMGTDGVSGLVDGSIKPTASGSSSASQSDNSRTSQSDNSKALQSGNSQVSQSGNTTASQPDKPLVFQIDEANNRCPKCGKVQPTRNRARCYSCGCWFVDPEE